MKTRHGGYEFSYSPLSLAAKFPITLQFDRRDLTVKSVNQFLPASFSQIFHLTRKDNIVL
jgi:hypothetical protein